ncbi:hypothetical protein HID58_026556 [Brassica napus]|uniref:Uncharacterized protein n=1 Tax=Brassica napus TaxID=3708 RepID=A0ABQ8CPC4_BRANA|nr:hypothetical protein HID58_026556 [Brassica napus]
MSILWSTSSSCGYTDLLIMVVFGQQVALAEWLRRVPAKYMGFPRESSNLSGDVIFIINF